jgi:NADPH-dependent ferric siderophore reductase
MSEQPVSRTRRPVPDHMFGGRLSGSFLLDLEVVEVEDLAAHVRSITVVSSDLVDFEYVAGQDLMLEFLGDAGSVRRRYTIRRADAATGMAQFEVELHDGGGPATSWAAHARVGDRLQAIGPRGAIALSSAAAHYFVVDDSSMPTAFAMIESLPADSSATALLVTPHGRDSRPGPSRSAHTSLVWMAREELVDSVARLHPIARAAVYLFGERQLVRTAGEILRSVGVPTDAIASKAYWRIDQANAPHGEPSFN